MKIKFVYKGGARSGNFGHAGRPGKVGGSASGSGGSVGNSVDVALASASYDSFVNAENQREFIETAVIDVAHSLGINTLSVKLLTDEEFDDSIRVDAHRAGVAVSAIKGYYTSPNIIRSRAAALQGISSVNEYEAVMDELWHEVSHAYQDNVMDIPFESITSQSQYNQSRSEDFSDIFSARVGNAWRRVNGLSVIGRASRTNDLGAYIRASEDLY